MFKAGLREVFAMEQQVVLMAESFDFQKDVEFAVGDEVDLEEGADGIIHVTFSMLEEVPRVLSLAKLLEEHPLLVNFSFPFNEEDDDSAIQSSFAEAVIPLAEGWGSRCLRSYLPECHPVVIAEAVMRCEQIRAEGGISGEAFGSFLADYAVLYENQETRPYAQYYYASMLKRSGSILDIGYFDALHRMLTEEADPSLYPELFKATGFSGDLGIIHSPYGEHFGILANISSVFDK